MSIYKNNGTTFTKIKKRYKSNGSTLQQVKKRYKSNGTSLELVYNAEEIIFDNGTLGDLVTDFIRYGGSIGDILSATSRNYSESRILSANKVDLTNFSKIHFESYCNNGPVSNADVGIAATNGQYDNFVLRDQPPADWTDVVIDISELSGSYYIVFCRCYTANATSRTVYTRKVWLE